VKHLFIKANDQSRFYGDPNPSFACPGPGCIITGQDPGLSGTTTCSTTATPSSPVVVRGYPITCSGQTPAEGVTYTAGTLTITKANQTITFAALANRTYGDSDFPVSAAASSGLAGAAVAPARTPSAETATPSPIVSRPHGDLAH
jgi:hypothetical protein